MNQTLPSWRLLLASMSCILALACGRAPTRDATPDSGSFPEGGTVDTTDSGVLNDAGTTTDAGTDLDAGTGLGGPPASVLGTTTGPASAANVSALNTAPNIGFWIGDVDGDGHDDWVFSAESAGPTHPKLHSTELEQVSVSGVVALTHDARGNIGLPAAGMPIDATHVHRVATLPRTSIADVWKTFVQEIQNNPTECGLLAGLGQALDGALKQQLLTLAQATQMMKTGMEPNADWSKLDDTALEQCLLTPQTFGGCLGLSLFGGVGKRNHCYVVSSSGSTQSGCLPDAGAPLDPPHNPVCSADGPAGSCCNAAFIYNKVFRADVANQAPIAITPASGPIPDGGVTVVLGTPADIADDFLSDYQTLLQNDVLAGVCLFDGLLKLRNPISVTVDPDNHCATNTTLPGHVLQGQVTQCIHQDDSGVYSTIVGTGTDTRFSTINEQVGPILLGGVLDHFRGNVASALKKLADQGATCDGDQVHYPTGNPSPRVHDGSGVGDPHLTTQDGTLYDFQRVGEFVFATDGTLTVQIRTAPKGNSRVIAVITAVATQVDGHLVEFDLVSSGLWRLLIDGQSSEGQTFSDGSVVGGHGVVWPDGTSLVPSSAGPWLSVQLFGARAFHGLVGDHDGNPSNDFQLRDGTVLTAPLSTSTFRTFTDSWRIAQAESLFQYGSGQTTKTFTDLNFPSSIVSTASLSSDLYSAAEQVCREAGVTNPLLLDACIYDVSYTGDPSFALATAGLPDPVADANPKIYGLKLDPLTRTVDVVGNTTMGPDGVLDEVFTATVVSPGSIRFFEFQTVNGPQWWSDVRGFGPSIHLLAVELDGVLLDGTQYTDTTGILTPGAHQLRFYANATSTHFKGQGAHLSAYGTATTLVAFDRSMGAE